MKKPFYNLYGKLQKQIIEGIILNHNDIKIMNLPPEYEDSPFIKEPMNEGSIYWYGRKESEEVKVEQLPEEIEPEAD